MKNMNVEEYIDFLKITLRILEKVMLTCRDINSVYSLNIKNFFVGLSLSKDEEQEYTIFVDTDDIDPFDVENLDYHMREVLDSFIFRKTYTSYSSVSYEFIKFIHLQSLNQIDVLKFNNDSGYEILYRDNDSILRYKTDKFFYNIQYPSKRMKINNKEYLIFKL